MKKMKDITLVLLPIWFVSSFTAMSQDQRRWKMNDDNSITWNIVRDLPHSDHIEMSGKKISVVLRYTVNADSSFNATRSVIWPLLRTIPNNTHASLTRRFSLDGFSLVTVNYKPIASEKVKTISLNGTVIIKSNTPEGLELTRQYFPSTTLPGYCELYTIHNNSIKTCIVEIPEMRQVYTTDSLKGTQGSYLLNVELTHSGNFNLLPRGELSFSIFYSGASTREPHLTADIVKEKTSRLALINELWNSLVLETPDTVLNREFDFAKIRVAESIYETKGGPMHSPGGESYYAAIWANDQAEYAGPFFPYLGYRYGNDASLNAYLHFARFMNDAYKPIPSSIIAEGLDIWNGAGDRGDAAMIAYGAARFALTTSDEGEARQVWPLIEWCLEYCKRKLNKEGVVNSDTDELEGRFPAGKANLNTSCLYYDALNSAVYLGLALKKDKKQLAEYKLEASQLHSAIEKYFGSTLEGFHTYKYYQENDTLRAWICVPLAMGIYDRKEGTIDALFSPRLWTTDGLASLAGDRTFWDRSTLYALRGVLAAGETEKALPFLHYYSNRRLLGAHVPYPVEAYPEGGQRHLAAESGLYCRIFTEGLFGIRPVGFKSLLLTPRLPGGWPSMQLKHIKAFGSDFDIMVSRHNARLKIKITANEKLILEKIVDDGSTIRVELK